MDRNPQDNRYEQLYEEIHSRAVWIHQRNKQQIKFGTISLFALPFLLFFIRWMTDSNKVLFLLIWIFGLFTIAFYLIGVEYLDHVMQKSLREMTDDEGEFDALFRPKYDPEQIIHRISRTTIAPDAVSEDRIGEETAAKAGASATGEETAAKAGSPAAGEEGTEK